jgi:hypothetical protein
MAVPGMAMAVIMPGMVVPMGMPVMMVVGMMMRHGARTESRLMDRLSL